jgi:hypothetical protein
MPDCHSERDQRIDVVHRTPLAEPGIAERVAFDLRRHVAATLTSARRNRIAARKLRAIVGSYQAELAPCCPLDGRLDLDLRAHLDSPRAVRHRRTPGSRAALPNIYENFVPEATITDK